MIETQIKQNRLDELHRCQDRSWLSPEEEKRFGVVNPVDSVESGQGLEGIVPGRAAAQFGGVIHISQKVSLLGERSVGLITKLFYDSAGQISYLAIRTARYLGHHKMVPIASVMDVTPSRVLLEINKAQFNEMPEYRYDSLIADDVDRALWKDTVLRMTDYDEIDVRVSDAVITLNGHVITSMNQWRAESAVDNIQGALDVKSYLIPDDKLTLEIAGALGQMEQLEGCKFFTRVENGLAVLGGEVTSTELRDEAEKRVSEIPEVRGILNKIHVSGEAPEPDERRFLQPTIGAELYFKDGVSVTIRKVVINPHNRLVTAVVVLGQIQDSLRKFQSAAYRAEQIPERLLVVSIDLLLILTPGSGFIQVNSDETAQFASYDPSRYITPDKDWLPPYPYCTAEVLFLAE